MKVAAQPAETETPATGDAEAVSEEATAPEGHKFCFDKETGEQIMNEDGTPKLRKSRASTKKKRADFESWEAWCDYNKAQCEGKAAEQHLKAQEWEARKAGEHVESAQKKKKKLANLMAMVAALQEELGDDD